MTKEELRDLSNAITRAIALDGTEQYKEAVYNLAESYANSVAIAELEKVVPSGKVYAYQGKNMEWISGGFYKGVTRNVSSAIARLKGEGGGNG